MKKNFRDKTNPCSFTFLFWGRLLFSINFQHDNMNIWLWNSHIKLHTLEILKNKNNRPYSLAAKANEARRAQLN